jgi:(p)ppGpp synthase/HD superfamily hydrolase
MTLARLTAAADLAARSHAGQTRKGGSVPYVNHVIEVAAMVAESGGTEDEVVAAFLHDTVEDTTVTLADIRSGFGEGVAVLVAAVTDDPAWKDLPRPDRKRRQAARLPSEPTGARRIKVADQTSNVRDIVRLPLGWNAETAAEYLEGAEMVVAACRGTSDWLEAAFDAAAAEAMQKIGGWR